MASSRDIALQQPGKARIANILAPLDNGPQEIRALDGLRAVAALSIVIFHTLLLLQFEYTPQSHAIGNVWYYLSTGVQLFFVLSGFLLFLPYARAMLSAKPLPSMSRFYQRRALRILPAYYVCLATTAAIASVRSGTPPDPLNLITHALFLHDVVPQFNRAYDGPFWTLAVEFQFYLLLPLIAALIARIVGSSRSPRRIVGAILGLIAGALVLRAVDVAVMNTLPLGDSAGSLPGGMFVLATMGMQGKNLEVFAIGMLCSVAYVRLGEGRALAQVHMRRIGIGLFAASLLIVALAAPHFDLAGLLFTNARGYGADLVMYSLIIGLGYGALLLGILWASPVIRAPFEWGTLRILGLISYSIYLWHLPAIHAELPYFSHLSVPLRIAGALLIAYLSYQVIERPFLARRRKTREAAHPQPTSLHPRQVVVLGEDADGVGAAMR